MGPRATGVPKSEKKMSPRYPGWCWDDRQSPLGPGRPVTQPPKCSVRPSGRARGGPRAGPRSPKMGPSTSMGGAEGSVVQVDGQKSTWVLVGLPFGCVWTPVAPKRCPLGTTWVHLGPECVLRAETEKCPYLRLDGPNHESMDTLLRCKPPL